MIKKLQEAQKKMKEIKARLEGIEVEGTSADQSVRIVINGNRQVKSIHLESGKTDFSDEERKAQLLQAMNSAIAAADRVNESEMKAAAGSMMPGLGNLMG